MNVLSVDPISDSILVEDHNGQKFKVMGRDLIEKTMSSANQYSRQETVSRTQAVEILTSARDTVFTVRFEKQDGSLRDLTGHLLSTENAFGRSNVVDLEVTTGNNQRQVDHRTLHFIVINNIKYNVK